jgi:hypothetical protein
MFRDMKLLMRAENRTGILNSKYNQDRKSLHLSSTPDAAWEVWAAIAAVV